MGGDAEIGGLDSVLVDRPGCMAIGLPSSQEARGGKDHGARWARGGWMVSPLGLRAALTSLGRSAIIEPEQVLSPHTQGSPRWISMPNPEPDLSPSPRRRLIIAAAAMWWWLLVSVGFALLPISMNVLSSLSQGVQFSFGKAVGNGELLLIASVLGATSIAEALAEFRKNNSVSLMLAAPNLLLVVLAALWYGNISTANSVGIEIDRYFVCWGSTVLLCTTLICSGTSHFMLRWERT